MNFDDIKRKNIRRQILRYIENVATSSDFITKHMYYGNTYHTFTLAEKSLNTRYVEDDDKFIIVPRTINNYVYTCKRNMNSKAFPNTSAITSFSKMTHYI